MPQLAMKTRPLGPIHTKCGIRPLSICAVGREEFSSDTGVGPHEWRFHQNDATDGIGAVRAPATPQIR